MTPQLTNEKERSFCVQDTLTIGLPRVSLWLRFNSVLHLSQSDLSDRYGQRGRAPRQQRREARSLRRYRGRSIHGVEASPRGLPVPRRQDRRRRCYASGSAAQHAIGARSSGSCGLPHQSFRFGQGMVEQNQNLDNL